VSTSTAAQRMTDRQRSTLFRWIIVTALAAFLTFVLAMLIGGGNPSPVAPGLPYAGLFTEWALPITRVIADGTGIACVGLLLAAGFLLPPQRDSLSDSGKRCIRMVVPTAVIWGFASLFEIALTLSDILGEPLSQSFTPEQIRSYVLQIPQGRALLVQAALAFLLAALVRLVKTQSEAALALLLALAALLPPTLTGHSSASSSHDLATSSLMIHVGAVGLWVGGLFALAIVARARTGAMAIAVPRFSRLALWCFVAVGISGVVNAAIRVGSVSALWTSRYGVLVDCKFAALVILGCFGWQQRKRAVPALVKKRELTVFLQIAAVELTVMASTVALAVALSRSPTPVQISVADLSPVRDLLGFGLPPAPTLINFLTQWHVDGFFLAAAIVLGVLYGIGLRIMHRRGDAWPLGRSISWFVGLAIMIYATSGGLATYAHVLFSAHMVDHMTLNMLVPIFLVLAAPVTLALRTIPVRHDGERGPREWLLAFVHSRPVAIVSNPIVAAALFIGSIYALYFSGLFQSLMSSHWGHLFMAVNFVLVGCIFFWTLIGIDPGPKRAPYLARLAVLIGVIAMHAFFSVALMQSTTVIAPSYFASLNRPYLINLLSDQHVGGGISWGMGELPIILVVGALIMQWVRDDERESRRFDRRVARAEAAGRVDDEVESYNAYLAALEEQARKHD
jgi:cytochrome c oxidase assembly factor CtaG/putative copper export protein